MSDGENKLRPSTTAGGHVEDRAQPALPVVHRRFANPSPLGLLSFATGTDRTEAALARNSPS